MKHARSDYNGIQDASGKIPEDEPVFVIRAQDVVGPKTVRDWAESADRAGAAYDIVQRAYDWAETMEAYARSNGTKVPDAPAGTLE